MTKILGSIVVVLALIIGGCTSVGNSQEKDAVLTTVKAYADYWNYEDYWKNNFGSELTYEIDSCEVTGDTANVRIVYNWKGEKKPERLFLKKKADTGEWFIDKKTAD